MLWVKQFICLSNKFIISNKKKDNVNNIDNIKNNVNNIDNIKNNVNNIDNNNIESKVNNTNKRKVSNLQKKMIASNQKWKCKHCNNILNFDYEVDHIIPLFKNGSNDMNNLQALCRNCHGVKSGKDRL